MGIVGKLKQISLATLETMRQDPLLVELFHAAQYLPESEESQEKFEQFRWANKYDREVLKNQFLVEWEKSALDLHKSWDELTFIVELGSDDCSSITARQWTEGIY